MNEPLLNEKRRESAAKAQYEYLMKKPWEEETPENRAQWILAMATALDAADAVMQEESSLSLTAEFLGALKFPDSEWDEFSEKTKSLLVSSALTITEATQGRV